MSSEKSASPLRIAQVVTYVSEDGAFGGPVAAAVMQTAALAELGHSAELFAGWDGRGHVDAPGVRVRLFRAVKGRLPLIATFPPTLPLALLRARRRLDVVHVHFGRDLVSTLTLAALFGWKGRIVLQPHGMVMPDDRTLVRVLDTLIVRPALARADAVLALTEIEELGLDRVSRARARILPIRNGVAAQADASTMRSGKPRALFLARLHPRKNAPIFVEAALRLQAEGVNADFVVAGPDEGDLPAVQALLAGAHGDGSVRYVGPVAPDETRSLLSDASLFVLPSVGEVFPMTVLESMAVGTPVILTADNGLATELQQGDAALLTAPTVEALIVTMRSALADNDRLIGLANRGLAMVRGRFGDREVANQLVYVYRGRAPFPKEHSSSSVR